MGKAAVVYVIGLSLIIGIGLANINQSSVGSMDTYSTYFGRTMAHNIALAAANIGTNKILFTNFFFFFSRFFFFNRFFFFFFLFILFEFAH